MSLMGQMSKALREENELLGILREAFAEVNVRDTCKAEAGCDIGDPKRFRLVVSGPTQALVTANKGNTIQSSSTFTGAKNMAVLKKAIDHFGLER